MSIDAQAPMEVRASSERPGLSATSLVACNPHKAVAAHQWRRTAAGALALPQRAYCLPGLLKDGDEQDAG